MALVVKTATITVSPKAWAKFAVLAHSKGLSVSAMLRQMVAQALRHAGEARALRGRALLIGEAILEHRAAAEGLVQVPHLHRVTGLGWVGGVGGARLHQAPPARGGSTIVSAGVAGAISSPPAHWG